MVKKHHRLLSAALSALMVTGTLASALPASATEVNEEKSDAAALYKQYSTNSAGFGANKTMSIDGDISDWDSSMIIAQGAANDDPRVYVNNSMHEIGLDLYALYAAYDDNNLYLMWEMTNVQDVVAPEQDYPLSQGRIYETQDGFNFNIAFDTGKSDTRIGNECRISGKDRGEEKGNYLWDTNIGYTGNVNKIVVDNCKGWNGPFVYGGDSTGLNPEALIDKGKSKTEMAFGPGILSKEVIGINDAYGTSEQGNHHRVVGDICDPSAAWADFNTLGHNSAKYDYFYEMSIPYDELGITADDVKNNGVGVMLAVTSGRSGMDCLPYDATMNDNADQPDTESQAINSKEKSDEDIITVPFARIGKSGGFISTDSDKPSDPDTESATDSTTDSTTDVIDTESDTNTDVEDGVTTTKVTAKSGDNVTVTYSISGLSDVAGISSLVEYDTSKLTYVGAKAVIGQIQANEESAGKVYWNNMFDDKTSFTSAKDVIKLTFKAKSDLNDAAIKNTVRDIYDSNYNTVSFNAVSAKVAVDHQTTDTDDTDSDTDIVTLEGKKVDVVAKAGDTITVKTTAKNSKDALGIWMNYNYDDTAMSYVKVDSAMGTWVDQNELKNTVGFNSMLTATGDDMTNETTVVTMTFKALKDIKNSDNVFAYVIKEFYDTSFAEFDHNNITVTASATGNTDSDTDSEFDPIPISGKKVDVVAKKGDVVTLYTKASNAPSALGIFQEINYNSNALKFEEFISAEGSYAYTNDIANQLSWNSLLDAKGSDYTNETDVAVIKFVALADITSDDDVMAYNMIEFYDTSFNDYNTDETIRCVAVTTHNDTDSDIVTDTDTQTDSDTDTQTDSDTDTQTDSDTDTQTDTDSDNPSDTDSDSDTESDTDSDTESDTDVEMVTIGDANGDGKVTMADAVEVLKYAMKIVAPSDKQTFVSDVNGDGRITIADATNVQKYALKIPLAGDIGKKKEYKPSK